MFSSLAKHGGGSSAQCRPHRPAARRLLPHARLFKIRSLQTDSGTVVLDRSEEDSPPLSSSLEIPPEPLNVELVQPNPPKARSSRATAPDSRSTLMASAGRKLIFATPKSITYLDGSLPGDYGFDPLGLADPSKRGQPGEDSIMNLRWLGYAELIHGRWAMLAAAGALAPEVLGMAGFIPQQTALPWFEAGGVLSSTQGDVQGIPFAAHIPFSYWADQGTLLWTMLVGMGFAEMRRLQDYRYPGSMGQQYFLGLENVLGGSGDCRYPGGRFFNLFNLGGGADSASMGELKVKEVKNGRLAMVAWLGFMVQACTTHKGPVQNLVDHITAPAANNILAGVGGYIQHLSPGTQAAYIIYLLAGFAAGALYKRAQDRETEALAGLGQSILAASAAESEAQAEGAQA